MNNYAYVEAQDLIKEHGVYHFNLSKGIYAFINASLKTYFTHKGYKDGLIGLHISLCMGMYSFLVRSYAHEIYKEGNAQSIHALYDDIAKKRIR
jgi:hypothetical protein